LIVSFRDSVPAETEDWRRLSEDPALVADGAAAAAGTADTPGNSRSSSLSGASVFGIKAAAAVDLFAPAEVFIGWRPLRGRDAVLVSSPPPVLTRPDPGRPGNAVGRNRTAPSVVLGGAVTPGAAALAN
jgi:hypothetical protein